MGNNYKITIPKPCHEDWNKMSPKDNGRFCLSCSKTVVDFTSMLPDEIQHFFIQNQGNKICGRFKKTQLDNVIIQIPNQILYSQNHYHKMFLLALFIAMGTTLFSCTDKNGDKKKIDKIEIVKTSKTEIIQVGKIKIKGNNNFVPPPPPPPKTDNVKFVKGKAKISDTKINSSSSPDCKASVQESTVQGDTYITGAVMETKADYPGGINNFYQFLVNELKLPKEAENPKGRIIVSFVIEKDGSLSSFEFPKNIDSKVEAEITRVLKLSPKWQPGEQNGKKTRIKYSLPMSFQ
ncbi:energy transducer TonB [Flavobacterium ajazii]|uniref:energy transducer TonB n=1 Tax=Flavobacterium ajazii TaxID=2692318 RepID=UPI0013D5B62F|nr:energy transducer TonB [Flavobacterium ajazii]